MVKLVIPRYPASGVYPTFNNTSLFSTSTGVLQMRNYSVRSCISAGRMLHVHSPRGSTVLREMTSWPPSWMRDVKSIIRLRHSMCIYLQNIPAKFHPGRLALGSLKRSPPTRRRTRKATRWVAIWDEISFYRDVSIRNFNVPPGIKPCAHWRL